MQEYLTVYRPHAPILVKRLGKLCKGRHPSSPDIEVFLAVAAKHLQANGQRSFVIVKRIDDAQLSLVVAKVVMKFTDKNDLCLAQVIEHDIGGNFDFILDIQKVRMGQNGSRHEPDHAGQQQAQRHRRILLQNQQMLTVLGPTTVVLSTGAEHYFCARSKA